jgi:FKBP-type peptidyl-prolyl cis-trans isomerase FklB
MKVGDKWKLFIPAKLAYGEQSPSPRIPPNSVLLFEVELLGIEK